MILFQMFRKLEEKLTVLSRDMQRHTHKKTKTSRDEKYSVSDKKFTHVYEKPIATIIYW